MTAVWIVLAIVVVIVLWAVMTYNGLISRRNKVDEGWSGIDVQLKRRHDLIPNLVETVKGYATHEREVLENVIRARSGAETARKAGDVHGTQEAENMLTGTLRQMFALGEAYPDLKANDNFRELQLQLADTEDKIQASRRIYNSNVNSYNTKIQQVPSNIIAGMGNFTPREFFEIENPAERETVNVSFS
jgi:LemA protein